MGRKRKESVGFQDGESRILEAALEEFRRHGYYKANLDRIAARVGVGKGTIYRRFPNKSVLFGAVALHLLEGAVERMRAAVEVGGFDDAWRGGMKVLESIAWEASFMRGLASEEMREILLRERFCPREAEDFLARVAAVRAELVGLLAGVIRRGRMEGRVLAEGEETLLAEFVVSLVHTFCFGRKAKESFLSADEAVCLERFIWRALTCPEAAS